VKNLFIVIILLTLLIVGCGDTVSTQFNAENNKQRVEQLSDQNQEFREELNEQENKISELNFKIKELEYQLSISQNESADSKNESEEARLLKFEYEAEIDNLKTQIKNRERTIAYWEKREIYNLCKTEIAVAGAQDPTGEFGLITDEMKAKCERLSEEMEKALIE
jgi:TolA-binding protein